MQTYTCFRLSVPLFGTIIVVAFFLSTLKKRYFIYKNEVVKLLPFMECVYFFGSFAKLWCYMYMLTLGFWRWRREIGTKTTALGFLGLLTP